VDLMRQTIIAWRLTQEARIGECVEGRLEPFVRGRRTAGVTPRRRRHPAQRVLHLVQFHRGRQLWGDGGVLRGNTGTLGGDRCVLGVN